MRQVTNEKASLSVDRDDDTGVLLDEASAQVSYWLLPSARGRGIATEAAVAIENARLYRETMEKARMEQEMRIAAEIQQALLPKPQKTGAFFDAFGNPYNRAFAQILRRNVEGGGRQDDLEHTAYRIVGVESVAAVGLGRG